MSYVRLFTQDLEAECAHLQGHSQIQCNPAKYSRLFGATYICSVTVCGNIPYFAIQVNMKENFIEERNEFEVPAINILKDPKGKIKFEQSPFFRDNPFYISEVLNKQS